MNDIFLFSFLLIPLFLAHSPLTLSTFFSKIPTKGIRYDIYIRTDTTIPSPIFTLALPCLAEDKLLWLWKHTTTFSLLFGISCYQKKGRLQLLTSELSRTSNKIKYSIMYNTYTNYRQSLRQYHHFSLFSLSSLSIFSSPNTCLASSSFILVYVLLIINMCWYEISSTYRRQSGTTFNISISISSSSSSSSSSILSSIWRMAVLPK